MESVHEGQTFKYCDTCGRWFYGTRGHFTAHHRRGEWNRSGATPSTTPGAITTPRATTVPLIAAVNAAVSDRAPPEMKRSYFSGGFWDDGRALLIVMLPFLFEMFLHFTFYMLVDTPLLSTFAILSPRRDTWDLPSEPQQLINFFLMRRCGLFVLLAQASLSFVTFTTCI